MMVCELVVLVVFLVVGPIGSINAFGSVRIVTFSQPRTHRLAATTDDITSTSSNNNNKIAQLLANLADVGYQVTVPKPLGIVFGENRAPYGGLVVDDVEPGLNGGKAGIRVGDQLMSVNGEYVVNGEFDIVMDKLRNSPNSVLDLQLYRGSVSSLFTIVMNKNGMVDADDFFDNNDDDQEEEQQIVMDENYEPPIVTAEDYEDNRISVSQVASEAFKSLGGLFSGGLKSILSSTSETIQLEGDDAKTGQKDL
jgi:PDZ domain